jgi:hypothetical protein
MAMKPMSAERLAIQKDVVEAAANSKMLNKYDGIMIGGNNIPNSQIIKAVCGELKNTHNAVFKKCLGKKACEHCGIEGPLDRAHMRSKLDVAQEALNEIHSDLSIPVDMKLFMRTFVLHHSNVGVWMLCKKCHRELG